MASLKDVSEKYKGVCESFVRKTREGLKDKGDSVFELPENYIEIALMKIMQSCGVDEIDIDWSEILQENPIDKSKWVPTLVYFDTDDTLGVRWDKFIAYNQECGRIDVYENSDTYESFYGQNEDVQMELYREVMDALGIKYVEPKTVYYQTLESFVGKVSRKRGSDLIPDVVYTDGVYILHESLGIKTVEGWNKKFNKGVIGILVVEDEHQLVVALEDSPNKLHWSKERKLINRQVEYGEDAESDFNGEEYCKNLNSPDFPAAYYCLNYKKGGRNWYLPSTGEMNMIFRYLEEIQTALSIVGGQKFATKWVDGSFFYWSSTEYSVTDACNSNLCYRYISFDDKIVQTNRVRPVSNFRKNPLKESFTKKISSKKNTDLISKPAFVPNNGVYILHETFGVKSFEGWNPKFNKGVVGILLIEDDHKFVVALEDSPENLFWSEEEKLVNRPVSYDDDAESDFNGEEYCRNLNSPEFPAAYYCSNYNKGGRDWYLPSGGELMLIYRHFEEIQTALSIVGGKKFEKEEDGDLPWYWSSTEESENFAWALEFGDGYLTELECKYCHSNKVRPISKFQPSELKESFTKKISKKTKKDLQDDADELLLPKNYIELALMSVLCSAKKEGICFRKPKFHYKDDFGDVYELSEVFLQNDGQEIGAYAQRHYLEIEWNVYENGHMEEEPDSDVYPFKDEDNEIKTAIYKKVIEHLGLDYVRPQKKWLEFDDDGFDYFDN